MDLRTMNAVSQTLDYIESNCFAAINNSGEANGWVVEPKFDGDRRMLHLRDGNRPAKLYGRRVSVKTGELVEKSENVPRLRFVSHTFEDTVLDGEILVGKTYECTSKKVTAIMGCKPDKAIERQLNGDPVYFVVFDCLRFAGQDLTGLPLSERRKYAKRVVRSIDSPAIKWVGEYTIKKSSPMEIYDHIVDQGGEGIMVKNLAAVYQCDKRPVKTWYKVKKEATFDVVITGFKTGNDLSVKKGKDVATAAKYSGMVGAVTLGLVNEDGSVADCGRASGFTDELRDKMTRERSSYIGRAIEVRCNDVTEKGKFRHPRFIRMRYDKVANFEDCGTWQINNYLKKGATNAE